MSKKSLTTDSLLDAPKVTVKGAHFLIATPQSTNEIVKEGYAVYFYGKASTARDFIVLGTIMVEKDGAGSTFEIERSHKSLQGDKQVAFEYKVDDEDTARVGSSSETLVAA